MQRSSRTSADPGIARALRYSAAVAIGMALGYWIYSLAFGVTPRQFRMLSRDWRSLELRTDLEPSFRTEASSGLVGSSLTGGGEFQVQTQLFMASVGGLSVGSTPRWRGEFSATMEDVVVEAYEIRGLRVFPHFGNATSRYQIEVWDGEDWSYISPPLEVYVRSLLKDRLVYQSSKRETITLEMPAATALTEVVFPALVAFSNDPMPLYWNPRMGCDQSYVRAFDGFSALDNRITISEACGANRAFRGSAWEDADRKTKLTYRTTSRIYDAAVVLYPEFFAMGIDGKSVIESTERNYLLLIEGSDGMFDVDIAPRDLEFEATFFVTDPPPFDEKPLLIARPNAQRLRVLGSIGKISVGAITAATDELSEIELEFSGWPEISWENWVVADAGDDSPKPRQLLRLEGFASSVILNGEQLNSNAWDRTAPEIRGAVIGGLVAVLSALFTIRYGARRPHAPPIAVVTVPAPESSSDQSSAPAAQRSLPGIWVISLLALLLMLWELVVRRDRLDGGS